MQHQKPNRPQYDVTQPFEDGLVVIYRQTDGNLGTGLLPKPQLQQAGKFAYQERKLGVQRYYNALQNQITIQRVIRIPLAKSIPVTTQDIAVTEDGKQYRIDLVQAAATFPPSLDLTLVSYDQGVTKEENDYDD